MVVVVVVGDMEGEGFGEAWRTTQGETVRKERQTTQDETVRMEPEEGREAYP